MPLDPQAEELLQALREMGRQPMETMTPAEARVAARAFKTLGGEPEDVASVEHCFIPGPSADLPARIYTPASAGDAPRPAMIYFHGSGWVILNIEICDSFSRALANRSGCVVVAVNYQKAPEHKFPVPFEDCYAATGWVFENAKRLGLGPNSDRHHRRQRRGQFGGGRHVASPGRERTEARLSGAGLSGRGVRMGYPVGRGQRRGVPAAAGDDAVLLDSLRERPERRR